ncbi:MAG: hypothetical protein ACQET4_15590 [Pseudomonadota bacterium]
MGIIEQLNRVVVTRKLDLSEMDESYVYEDEEGNERPVKLPYRVNWPRRLKAKMYELVRKTGELQADYGAIDGEDDEAWEQLDDLNARSEAITEEWDEWWAEVLMMAPDEVEQLREAIPSGHWMWIGAQIRKAVKAYEDDAEKKATDARSPTSEEQEASRQKSSSEQK